MVRNRNKRLEAEAGRTDPARAARRTAARGGRGGRASSGRGRGRAPSASAAPEDVLQRRRARNPRESPGSGDDDDLAFD